MSTADPSSPRTAKFVVVSSQSTLGASVKAALQRDTSLQVVGIDAPLNSSDLRADSALSAARLEGALAQAADSALDSVQQLEPDLWVVEVTQLTAAALRELTQARRGSLLIIGTPIGDAELEPPAPSAAGNAQPGQVRILSPESSVAEVLIACRHLMHPEEAARLIPSGKPLPSRPQPTSLYVARPSEPPRSIHSLPAPLLPSSHPPSSHPSGRAPAGSAPPGLAKELLEETAPRVPGEYGPELHALMREAEQRALGKQQHTETKSTPHAAGIDADSPLKNSLDADLKAALNWALGQGMDGVNSAHSSAAMSMSPPVQELSAVRPGSQLPTMAGTEEEIALAEGGGAPPSPKAEKRKASDRRGASEGRGDDAEAKTGHGTGETPADFTGTGREGPDSDSAITARPPPHGERARVTLKRPPNEARTAAPPARGSDKRDAAERRDAPEPRNAAERRDAERRDADRPQRNVPEPRNAERRDAERPRRESRAPQHPRLPSDAPLPDVPPAPAVPKGGWLRQALGPGERDGVALDDERPPEFARARQKLEPGRSPEARRTLPPVRRERRSSRPARGRTPSGETAQEETANSLAPLPELTPGDSVRIIADAIRNRFTGTIAFEDESAVRRIVFRDGDFVTAASGLSTESLVAYLAESGSVARSVEQRLGHKLPNFGRHAGAALVAAGYLEQQQLWPALRAHAEELVCRTLMLDKGSATPERNIPERLRAEPSVFGEATGAEVYLELLRRSLEPDVARKRLGGPDARLAMGAEASLVEECSLDARSKAELQLALSYPLDTALRRVEEPEFACVLYGLLELRCIAVAARGGPRRERAAPQSAEERALALGDVEALRELVQVRRALVQEGDYFALLGVQRSATGYAIRSAYLKLRRIFDPQRVGQERELLDLEDDVHLIHEVLEEAYSILGDAGRRERYLAAIESTG